MSDRFLHRWVGVTFSLVGVVSVLWLGVTGQLELYVHPRYTVFTVVMAVIGGLAAAAAFLLVPRAAEHDHELDEPRPRWRVALSVTGTAVLLAASVVALLVLPPATLTSATAENRDITDSSALASSDTAQLLGGDSASFTVKDWATLLHQGLGDDFFADKRADVSGFLVASDDPDVVYVARFLVTCCAVDALPIGVPVLIPDWQSTYTVDDWVQVRGGFDANPDAAGTEPIVLVPDEVVPIDRPAQPYVY